MVVHDNHPEVTRFVKMQELDLEKCDTACILEWIKRVMAIRRKAKIEVLSNIRQYFNVI